MTTGCPSAVVSFSPTVRARMSVVPPGANGTTHLIGFDGHACACASAAIDARAMAAIRRRLLCIAFSSIRCWWRAISPADDGRDAFGVDADRGPRRDQIRPGLVIDRNAASQARRAVAALDVTRGKHGLARFRRR